MELSGHLTASIYSEQFGLFDGIFNWIVDLSLLCRKIMLSKTFSGSFPLIIGSSKLAYIRLKRMKTQYTFSAA